MKKTLIACGVASAFLAGSAFAADVQLYGLINTGLSYKHTDSDTGVKTNKFSMENGQEFGSRWGIKGSEDLGNGYKISFVLESGFESDTGALDSKQNGRLFGREANMTLSGGFGEVSFGRLDVFGSVLGANGLFRAIDPLFANYTSFGSGKASASMWTRVDNAISYKTPTFAGLTGYAMYSFKNDSTTKGEEGKTTADRYAAIGLRYLNAGLEAVLVADTTNWGTVDSKNAGHGWTKDKDDDDGYTVTLGGNYKFANGIKPIIWGQYFNNQFLNSQANGGDLIQGLSYVTETATDKISHYGFVTGWGAGIGLHVPAFGGVAKIAANYRDMDNEKDIDFKRWSVYAGYDYNLSKRTALYVMTGYNEEKVESKTKSATPNAYEFCFGILHRF